MREVSVRYAPPPTVSRFMRSNAFVRLVMGPVGSGKSSGCNTEFLVRAKGQKPGRDGIRRTRFAAIRNTYGQLRDTTRKTFEQWIPRELGEWNEQQFTFTIRHGDIHSEILFRALDRPEDVKKLLSLELTGCYFNELREIAKPIFDGMQGRVGRYPSMQDGGASWFGIWGDTNPWHTGHWGAKLFRKAPPGFELYRQPGGRAQNAENVQNLPVGYYERLCHGKSDDWVRVYVDGQEALSDLGSVYGNLIDALEQRGSISDFEYDADAIHLVFDLGGAGHRGDATSMWAMSMREDGWPDFVDYYENVGKPASHYFDKAEEWGYRYSKVWLPHDARAKSFQTGASTLEQFIKHFGPGKADIGPELTLADGIEAGRWLLGQPIRFNALNCEAGLEMLREYRYEWDEANACFSNRPLHNFASHGADGYRYAACVVQNARALMKKPEAPPKVDTRPPTLNEMWEEHANANSGKERYYR